MAAFTIRPEHHRRRERQCVTDHTRKSHAVLHAKSPPFRRSAVALARKA